MSTVINVKDRAQNVLGEPLLACCTDPMTGYFRDGYCKTDQYDHGKHVVCAKLTQEFLDYSFSQGNDLMTARPVFNFPGLKAGDCWCLCADRWYEAYKVGLAPQVNLQSTHKKALDIIPLSILEEMASQ
ncbi:MAG: hypothetical protein ACI9D5_001887 [Candidatus Endobugula sp.]|jgi:uncharacterized protein (DUF2237 family)